jgi:hypothetical protein
MSDDNQLPEDNIQRIGKKDQKKRLDNAGPLFPEEEQQIIGQPGGEAVDEIISTEEPTEEQLQAARELEEGINRPVIPIIYTPAEDRFPSLSGDIRQEAQQALENEHVESETGKRRRLQGNWLHDLVAFLFVLLTLALLAYYSIIWRDPYSTLNPFSPPTPFVLVTWTPDYGAIVNIYGTQTSEAVVSAQNAQTPVTTDSPDNTDTTPLASASPFKLADSGVIYIPNANGRGCNWASIAGVVTGLGGEFLDGYIIQIIDAEDPTRLNIQVFSGSSETFGDGGFEFNLGGAPKEGKYIVQLLSQERVPVSDEYLIFTYDACDQNVAIINFQQRARF